MTRFIQIHTLTAYPPSNLNRDDLGRPKTAIIGGTTRLRVSSQSLKRAWRTSDAFEKRVEGAVGTRTREAGKIARDILVAGGLAEKQAQAIAKKIADRFGKAKGDEGLTEQLVHIAPSELEAIKALARTLAADGREPSDEELELLREHPAAADIAMFGRMLAAVPRYNVDAAVQVAHAFTVNAVPVESDYFTAVDDLNAGDEDRGAGHVGESGFGSGVFYGYVCIDRDQLLRNLQGDEGLARKATAGLIEALATVPPGGKQATFASRAYASFVLCEKGSAQPRTLGGAFVAPIKAADVVRDACGRLAGTVQRFDEGYGPTADARRAVYVHDGDSPATPIAEHGTLAELLAFATE